MNIVGHARPRPKTSARDDPDAGRVVELFFVDLCGCERLGLSPSDISHAMRKVRVFNLGDDERHGRTSCEIPFEPRFRLILGDARRQAKECP